MNYDLSPFELFLQLLIAAMRKLAFPPLPEFCCYAYNTVCLPLYLLFVHKTVLLAFISLMTMYLKNLSGYFFLA